MSQKKTEHDDNEIPIYDDFSGAKRNFSGRVKIAVDTFKLESAKMIKNIGFGKRPKLEDMEHCHIYHTYDSNGSKLKGTNQVGGHYHEIEVSIDEKTGDLVGKCSPPIQNLRSETIVGKDLHIHQVRYLKSEKIELRKVHANAESFATNYLKEDRTKTAGLKGHRVD